MPQSVAGQVVRDACREFPKLATKTLADRLARQHPKLFNSAEHARNVVRYYRGEKGGPDRGRPGVVGSEKRLSIPESDARPTQPVRLDAKGSGLVVADVHLPYHDKRAVELAIEHAVRNRHTDFCLIVGDLLDCYQLSRFDKDPRRRSFAGELAVVKQVLGVLCERFKRVVWKLGNHEDRYDRYLTARAPALLDVKEFDFRGMTGADELGVEVVPASAVMYAGELSILHGHEYAAGLTSPVNPARGMFLRAGACTLSAHMHRTSHHNEPDIRGRLTSCWSVGCLCDLHPEYRPLNKWDEGFAILEYDGKRDFRVELRRIIGNQVV